MPQGLSRSPLVRMDRPHFKTRLEMVLLDFRTYKEWLNLQRRSVVGFEISHGEGEKTLTTNSGNRRFVWEDG